MQESFTKKCKPRLRKVATNFFSSRIKHILRVYITSLSSSLHYVLHYCTKLSTNTQNAQ